MSTPPLNRWPMRLQLTLSLVCLTMSAAFADTTVTANFSTKFGAPSHVGAGYLYGLSQDGSSPNDSLLLPLQITLMRGGGGGLPGHGWIGDGYAPGPGYQARIKSALDQARRVTRAPYHATYDLLLSDLYGMDGPQPAGTMYPCDNGNNSNYLAFIQRVVADVNASGLYVSFDIMNEPDNDGFWPRGINSPQYFQMWDTAVREIRRLKPGAWIIGPSFSNFNSWRIGAWLDHVKAAGTLPDYLNWHFSDNVIGDGVTASNLLSSRGISDVKLSMNEFIWMGYQNSGYTAWYLTQLGKSNIQAACRAVWGKLYDGSLCQTLVDSGGSLQPTGQYWVMRRYSDLSGSMVSTQANGGVDLIAATDSSFSRATVLLGSSTFFTGNATVNITGLNTTPYLISNNRTQVVVEKIPDTGQSPLSNPIVIQNGLVTVNNGQLSITIPWWGNLDAYAITLTSPSASPSISTGNHTLIPMNAQGSRLEASNWGTANGTRVQIWQVTNGSNQLWYFSNNGDGSYSLAPSYSPGTRLDVSGLGTTNGTLVQLWQATSGTNQKWFPTRVSGNIYTLNPGNAPSMRLDVFGQGTANGSQVHIWQATGASNQQWQIN
jgi:hypothetical protein